MGSILEEYQSLVEVLRVYDEMNEEDKELYKDEFVQLDWNRRLLFKELYDTQAIGLLEDFDEDNIIPFYTKEEQKQAALTAKELYDTDILVCEMDAPELCCDEL